MSAALMEIGFYGVCFLVILEVIKQLILDMIEDIKIINEEIAAEAETNDAEGQGFPQLLDRGG